MKIYSKDNVYDAAKKRIARLFEEFPNVGVWSSGGKDSTVIVNLTLEVAEELGRLPVTVCFVDQEAEWQAVVDYQRIIANDPRVNMHWLQVPIRLFNATSMDSHWLNCWDENEEWMRDKEPNSIKENVYGTDRFYPIFGKYLEHHFPNQKTAFLGGVRAEESPNRATGLTVDATYKDITYGKKQNVKQGHYTFYPIYDWSYRDVWKAIHDNKWDYCKIYDQYYKHGINPIKMRVSNLHHETAVDQLFYLHEMEADTWGKLTKRLQGINQTHHMTRMEMYKVKELPFMFETWKEYRDYLVEKLVSDDEIKQKFKKKFAWMDNKYEGMNLSQERHDQEVACILANDFEFTKLNNFESRPASINFWKHKRGKLLNWHRSEGVHLKYIRPEIRGKDYEPAKSSS